MYIKMCVEHDTLSWEKCQKLFVLVEKLFFEQNSMKNEYVSKNRSDRYVCECSEMAVWMMMIRRRRRRRMQQIEIILHWRKLCHRLSKVLYWSCVRHDKEMCTNWWTKENSNERVSNISEPLEVISCVHFFLCDCQ